MNDRSHPTNVQLLSTIVHQQLLSQPIQAIKSNLHSANPNSHYLDTAIVLAIILATQLKTKLVLVAYIPQPSYVVFKPLDNNNTTNSIMILHNHQNQICFEHPTMKIKLLSNQIEVKSNDEDMPSISISQAVTPLNASTYHVRTRRLVTTSANRHVKLLQLSKLYPFRHPVIKFPSPVPQLALSARSPQLVVRSLNGTSWAKVVNGLSRAQWLKSLLLQNHDNPREHVHIWCLQETLIAQEQLTKHDIANFNDYYWQFTIPYRANQWFRGQMILISKQLGKPKLMEDLIDRVYCTYLPVEFQIESTNFIIASIYINPERRHKQLRKQAVVDAIKKTITRYPDHELILIGDFNLKALQITNDIIEEIGNNNIRPLQITHHNYNDNITFIRGKTATSPDHAITISQQNLNFQFTIGKDNIVPNAPIISEHHTLQLTLQTPQQQNAAPDEQQPEHVSPFISQNNDTYEDMDQLMRNQHQLIQWASQQKNQRALMDHSYDVNRHGAWATFNTRSKTLLDEINEIGNQRNMRNKVDAFKPRIDEICHGFYAALFESIGAAQTKILRERPTRPMQQLNKQRIIAMRCKKSFNALSVWKLFYHAFHKRRFKSDGLTTTTTGRIIEFNVHRYRENVMKYWQNTERDFVKDEIDQYTKLSLIRNNHEAEKSIEKIANHFAHVKVKTKKHTNIRVFPPNANIDDPTQLSQSNEETANNFTLSQQHYEDRKRIQSENAQRQAVELIQGATRNERDILRKVKTKLYDDAFIKSPRYNWINKNIRPEEVEKQLMNSQSFAASGVDEVSAALLKLCLQTNSGRNYHINPDTFDPRKIMAEKDLGDVDYKVNYKTEVNSYNRHFESTTNETYSPMLIAIQQLLNIVFRSGYTPKLWQVTEIVNIPKTTTPSHDCGQYRPISLSTTLQKTLNGVLNQRLLIITPFITHNNQTGYKNKRDRGEAIIGLFNYLMTRINANDDQTRYTIFIDLAKAFNSIPHDKLIKILKIKLEQDDDGIFCRYIENMYNNLHYYNNVDASVSIPQQQFFGIKQGCTISSTLFIIYFDLVITGLVEMRDELTPPPANNGIIDEFIAGYADDLVISTTNLQHIGIYVQLLSKLLKMTQLDLNVTKTKVLLTNPNSTAPCTKTIRVTTSNREVMEFEMVKKFKYLGFHFHYNLKFNDACADINIGYLKMKYRRLLRSQCVPTYIKKLVIQRYLMPVLFTNAPIIGVMMCLSSHNLHTLKNNITAKFTEMLQSIFYQPNSTKTAAINVYTDLNILMPQHVIKLQMFATIVKLTMRHNQLIDYVRNQLVYPNETSPIFNALRYLVTKIRWLKLPYTKTYRINQQTYAYQEKWVYDGFQSLPAATIDLLRSEGPWRSFPQLFRRSNDLTLQLDRPMTIRRRRNVSYLDTIQQVRDHLHNQGIPNASDELCKELRGFITQQVTQTHNLYNLNITNEQSLPILVNGSKPGYIQLLMHSIIGNKYSKATPTLSSTIDSNLQPILFNAFARITKHHKTTALTYLRQTALSANLVLKLEMHHHKYNWNFVQNLRLHKWHGQLMTIHGPVRQLCRCGQLFNFNHILTCHHFSIHRRLAIQNVWRILHETGIYNQIMEVKKNIPLYHRKVRKMKAFINKNLRLTGYLKDCVINEPFTHSYEIKLAQDLNILPGHFIIKQPGRGNQHVKFRPLYYAHLLLSRDTSKYLLRHQCNPTWLNEHSRQVIRTLFKCTTLQLKLTQFEHYNHIPTPNNLERHIKHLQRRNELHFFHSPPHCPDVTVVGTIYLLFTGELINLISDHLRPWVR